MKGFIVKFISQDHAENFLRMKEKYPQVEKAGDYCAACYIIALPEVFEHVGDPGKLEWPFSWCYDYETVEVGENDDWDYTKNGKYYRRDSQEDESGHMVTGSRFAGLSGGARRLVKAAMNLYNGANDFNLEDGICSWDDRLFQVFINACLIRRGSQLG
ncbi:hypothetical protein D1872_174800 [compost metagenome]